MSEVQMKYLFTGFEPFGGESINPSAVVAQAISRKVGADCLILPVSYQRSFDLVRSALETGKYQGLISIGQAGGRSKVCLERVALNFDDTESPDVDGVLRVERQIEAQGPHAIMNFLPLRDIVHRVESKVGPVEISSTAGTYVCNSLYYKVFRWMSQNPEKLKWQIFIHVPYLPEQMVGKDENTPYLSESVMERAVLETFKNLTTPSELIHSA